MKRTTFLYLALMMVMVFPADAEFSFFSKPVPANDSHKPLFLIAVAPFIPRESPTLLQKDPGREFQHKIALELRADRRLRVVELSEAVSMGSPADPQLSEGFDNAQKLLVQSGADLLIWGNQGEGLAHPLWDIYVTAGSQVQNQVRSEGFFLNGTTLFSGIQEEDTVGVLGWAVESWRGLIDRSYGMDIAPQIKEMIQKTDQALSLAYEKQWSQETRTQMKRYLSVLLCLYAVKTQDSATLDRAVSLTGEMVQTHSSPEDSYNWACYENNLGTLLQTRGMKERSAEDLQGAVKAYRAALRSMSFSSPETNNEDIQLNLAECLIILGRREGTKDHAEEGISILRKALAKTPKTADPHRWMDIQIALAAAYTDLGSRGTDWKYLRLAIRHYGEVLKVPGLDGMPVKKVQVLTNLGNAHASLGGRRQSVEDYQQAIRYLGEAVPLLRTMSSSQNLGIALLNRGTCQMNLGRLQNKEDLWGEAAQSYSEATSLFAQGQNRMEWASIQRDSGNLALFRAEKKMEVPGLQNSLACYVLEETVHQKKTMPLLWAQASVMECLVWDALGEKTCGLEYIRRAKSRLMEMNEILDSQKEGFTSYEENSCLGAVLESEGRLAHDPDDLRKSAETFEEALKKLEGTEMEAQRCSLQSGLCLSLAELLALSPEAETEQKAKALLRNLDPDFGRTAAPVDRYLHWANRAQLEGVLAFQAKDLAALLKARDLCRKAVQGMVKEGYAYYGARKGVELGDLEMGLEALGPGKGWAAKAEKQYAKSLEVLGLDGSCWKGILGEKIKDSHSREKGINS